MISNLSNWRKTASADQYLSLNNKNMRKECPGSQYDRARNISIMILEESESKDEFYLKDITYLDLDEAYQKYIVENCNKYPDPFQYFDVVYPDLLKNRIISQRKYRDLKDKDIKNDNKPDKDYFVKYCLNMESEEERIYLDNTMHFDDHLIDWDLSCDFGLREKAMSLIYSAPVGSWLVRRSSVKEQEHVKIRVITCKVNQEIRNYLLAHINGFGYVLTNGVQGSSMPSLGENKTIKIEIPFYSLPKLLDYMKTHEGIDLNSIIKNN
jgi:hypothetical protein